MTCKEVKVMMVDIKLLQPGICSTMKIDQAFLVARIHPNISLQFICSQPKGSKGDPITTSSFGFTLSLFHLFPATCILIVLIYAICSLMSKTTFNSPLLFQILVYYCLTSYRTKQLIYIMGK